MKKKSIFAIVGIIFIAVIAFWLSNCIRFENDPNSLKI